MFNILLTKQQLCKFEKKFDHILLCDKIQTKSLKRGMLKLEDHSCITLLTITSPEEHVS